MNEVILELLGGRGGEPLTLDELVHELTVLRANGRDLPQITRAAVASWLLNMPGVREDGGRWGRVYADEPQQRSLF